MGRPAAANRFVGALTTMCVGLALGAVAMPARDEARSKGFVETVRRAHDSGFEEYVAFEQRPAREELTYAIDPARDGLFGLRLVSNILEIVDAQGTPRRRIDAPWVIDATAHAHPARLAIEGCVVDTRTAPPWDHTPTQANGPCTLHVTWKDVRYPIVVDPNFTTTGVMARARSHHTATRLPNGRVLLAGGATDAVAEIFDPTTRTFAVTGAMTTDRRDASAVLLDTGKVLIAGGIGGGLRGLASAETFDPTSGTFTATIGVMTTAHSRASAERLPNGKVLIAGGLDASDPVASTNVAELFDPIGETFSTTTPLKVARHGAMTAPLGDGDVLIAGGVGASGAAIADVERYVATTESFTTTGPLGIARSDAFVTPLASGGVLVGGGDVPVFIISNSAESYDPTSGVFTYAGATPTYHVAGSALLMMPSGRVLVAGGRSGNPRATSVWDPVTREFLPAGLLAQGREGATATLLGDGSALFAGGEDPSNGNAVLSSAEVFAFAAAGASCGGPGECASGSCNDGVCCAGPCTGVCKTCNTAGECVAVVNAEDLEACFGRVSCDANGICRAKNGEACLIGSNCLSGYCVDGRCCNVACDGVCEACDVPAHEGTCAPAPKGPPHNDRLCPGGATICSGQCDGTSRTTCVLPGPETSCGSGCDDEARAIIEHTCNGSGVCVAQPARACEVGTQCSSGRCVGVILDGGSTNDAAAANDAASPAVSPLRGGGSGGCAMSLAMNGNGNGNGNGTRSASFLALVFLVYARSKTCQSRLRKRRLRRSR